MESPILFLVFSRPDTTRRVFEAIRAARPARLYVAADGPRSLKPGEAERCAEVRRIVDEGIDWPCQVFRRYRSDNLGCRAAVSDAITWFFEAEPEGIILEDDCLPGPDFFRFCEVMLNRYRDDERIMHIGGANFQDGQNRGDYYFSHCIHVWGWASWRRAWMHYDVNMALFRAARESQAMSIPFPDARVRRHWLRQFRLTHEGKIGTWDHQWTFTVLTSGALAIIPGKNLVSNIGFGDGATHTYIADDAAGFRPIEALEGSASWMKAPVLTLPDQKADRYTWKYHYNIRPLPVRAVRKLVRILRRWFR